MSEQRNTADFESGRRPKLLDLFCGAGGAGMGYHRAGFDVVGVDIAPQPHYPFEFHQADVMVQFDDGIYEAGFGPFDAVHASPPCQGYTTMNNRHGSSIPKLIEPVRGLLVASGLPYVMENVPGALRALRSPLELTGEMFGLRVHRPRLFESNVLLLSPPRSRRQADPIAVYGKNDGRRLWTRADGSELRVADLETAREAMDMPWADWDGVKEAIPPAYTEWIGCQLLQHIATEAVA